MSGYLDGDEMRGELPRAIGQSTESYAREVKWSRRLGRLVAPALIVWVMWHPIVSAVDRFIH